MTHRQTLVAHSGKGSAAKQRHGGRRFGTGGAAVGDVESRRHLVAIFGFEASRGESHRLHHVRVDDAQSLLLPTADEKRAIYLHIIYIYRVLVETTTTHVVL